MKTIFNSMGINSFFVLAIIFLFGLLYIPNYNHLKEKLGFDTVESVKKELQVQQQVNQSLKDENTNIKDHVVKVEKLEVVNVDTRLQTNKVITGNKKSFKKIETKIISYTPTSKTPDIEQLNQETLKMVVNEVNNAYILTISNSEGV